MMNFNDRQSPVLTTSDMEILESIAIAMESIPRKHLVYGTFEEVKLAWSANTNLPDSIYGFRVVDDQINNRIEIVIGHGQITETFSFSKETRKLDNYEKNLVSNSAVYALVQMIINDQNTLIATWNSFIENHSYDMDGWDDASLPPFSDEDGW